MVKKHKHQYFLNPGSLLSTDDPGFQIIDFVTQEVIQYTCVGDEVKRIKSIHM